MNVDGLDVDDVLLIVDCTIQVNEVRLDRLDASIRMNHEMCSSAAKFDSVGKKERNNNSINEIHIWQLASIQF